MRRAVSPLVFATVVRMAAVAIVTAAGIAVAACAPGGGAADDDDDDGGSAIDDDGGGASGDGGANDGGGIAALWAPTPGTTWQWQLSGLPLDTSIDVAMYDVDLFDTDVTAIQALQAQGRVVICYLSAGTYEPYRPDVSDLPSTVKGNALDPPFGDELWLDIRATEVRDLLRARLDLAVTKGCDGVEPDNVDGYTNDPGFPFTADDQLAFNRFVATEAHARALSVGLKNDLDQLVDLEASFDWALNEECFTYDECDVYTDTFIAAGKAVFHAEYVDAAELNAVCAVTGPLDLSTIVKHIELDAYRLACP